jgi:centromeric protein E
MMGFQEQPGVIPQAIDEVFAHISAAASQAVRRAYLLRVSYLEIYNESIRDLLAPVQVDLKISAAPGGRVCIIGCREEVVSTPAGLMSVHNIPRVDLR